MIIHCTVKEFTGYGLDIYCTIVELIRVWSRLYSLYFQISMIDSLHVKLMPLHVWCLCMFGEGKSHKTCTGIKNKNTKVWASCQGWGSIDYKRFFVFDACAGVVKIMLCLFLFFWCLCMFCQSVPRWKKVNNLVSPAFQTLQVQITL